MLIKKYKRKGYDFIELRQGLNGNGKKIYILQTQRKGKNRRNIYWQETFNTKQEAERWAKAIK